MDDHIMFDYIVPGAFALAGGLLVLIAIKCIEIAGRSWDKEEVKMADYHVSAGIAGIFAGVTNAKGEWKDRSCVTDEAIEAVRDYFMALCKTDEVESLEYIWKLRDGRKVVLTMTSELQKVADGRQDCE